MGSTSCLKINSQSYYSSVVGEINYFKLDWYEYKCQFVCVRSNVHTVECDPLSVIKELRDVLLVVCPYIMLDTCYFLWIHSDSEKYIHVIVN